MNISTMKRHRRLANVEIGRFGLETLPRGPKHNPANEARQIEAHNSLLSPYMSEFGTGEERLCLFVDDKGTNISLHIGDFSPPQEHLQNIAHISRSTLQVRNSVEYSGICQETPPVMNGNSHTADDITILLSNQGPSAFHNVSPPFISAHSSNSLHNEVAPILSEIEPMESAHNSLPFPSPFRTGHTVTHETHHSVPTLHLTEVASDIETADQVQLESTEEPWNRFGNAAIALEHNPNEGSWKGNV